jgi:hypothetical protein
LTDRLAAYCRGPQFPEAAGDNLLCRLRTWIGDVQDLSGTLHGVVPCARGAPPPEVDPAAPPAGGSVPPPPPGEPEVEGATPKAPVPLPPPPAGSGANRDQVEEAARSEVNKGTIIIPQVEKVAQARRKVVHTKAREAEALPEFKERKEEPTSFRTSFSQPSEACGG